MHPHRQMTCSGFCFVGQRPQIAVDPLFGVIPDGAGVQHHDVRLSGVVGELAAHVPQHSQNVLAVGHILLAAEGVHQRIDGLAPLLMEGRQLASILPLPLQLRFVQKNCFSINGSLPAPVGCRGTIFHIYHVSIPYFSPRHKKSRRKNPKNCRSLQRAEILFYCEAGEQRK